MAFKDLHKLKKINEIQKEYIQVPHLVVGKDIFALSTYRVLQQKYGKEQVRLLSEDVLLTSGLLLKGPSSLRGVNNQGVMKELYPEAISESDGQPALFYKDMSWKSFGGRSKPEALKFSEIFFTTSRCQIDLAKIFKDLEDPENFVSEMNSEAYTVRMKSIQRSESGSGFKVECLNGTEFDCDKLYFGQSPYQYLHLYSHKNELSDLFIEFCESTKASSALFVKFVFEKPLTDMSETLFIPLSYTHEWGHFIGEFNKVYKGEDSFQEIEFLHFLDEDHTSEEEISKIIRLLKKSMEKIFEKFSKINFQEYIVLEQEIGCLKIDDNLFKRTLVDGKNEAKNLFFLGINAPIYETQCVDVKFDDSHLRVDVLARALLVHACTTQKI